MSLGRFVERELGVDHRLNDSFLVEVEQCISCGWLVANVSHAGRLAPFDFGRIDISSWLRS
jgi:hypothetical protein